MNFELHIAMCILHLLKFIVDLDLELLAPYSNVYLTFVNIYANNTFIVGLDLQLLAPYSIGIWQLLTFMETIHLLILISNFELHIAMCILHLLTFLVGLDLERWAPYSNVYLTFDNIYANNTFLEGLDLELWAP